MSTAEGSPGTKCGSCGATRGKQFSPARSLAHSSPSPPTKETKERKTPKTIPQPLNLDRLGLRADALALKDDVRGGGARLEVGGERGDLERHCCFVLPLCLKEGGREKKRELWRKRLIFFSSIFYFLK